MTIPQLVERGIDIIKYIPGVDTPGDNTKAITQSKPSWKHFPSVKANDPIDQTANYAIRPTHKFVDIDFDCEAALEHKYEFFSGGIAQFGRDKEGHTLYEISDPKPFTTKRIEFGDKCLLEMRGAGCYSVLQGRLTGPDGKAEVLFLDDNNDQGSLTFSQCQDSFYNLALICLLVEGYEGTLNNYLIRTVGEMARKKVPHKTIEGIIERVLISIGREGDTREKMNSVRGILKGEKYSTIEQLSWTPLQVEQVREVIAELVEDEEEYKKPQTMEWTALSTIIETEYDPLVEIVEGMLTPGLWFLAAKPKLGKSFLTMQLAHAVATGSDFLGRKTIKGSVLFVALEDNARRIHSRAKMMGLDKCNNCYFTFVSPKLMDGLEEQLIQKAKELGDCKLIVIDTFIRAKSSRKKIGGNDSYEEASFLIDKFQRMLIAEDICCMANTHDKKEKESKGDDKVNRMTGSAAYQGQDGNWRLDRRRGGNGIDDNTLFTIVARDLPEQEYEIKLNQGNWRMVGVAEKGEEHDKMTRNILDCVQILQDIGGDVKTVELVEKMRQSNFIERNPDNKLMYERGDNNVKAKVKSMKKRGLLVLSGERYAAFKIPAIVVEDPPQEDMDYYGRTPEEDQHIPF